MLNIQVKNFPLEQNIFSLTYCQSNWGMTVIEGVGNCKSFSKLGGGANELKWMEKNENSEIHP